MTTSKIEWTDISWNPVTGCTKVSAGCKNCYAEKMSKRLQAMNIEKYKDGFSVIKSHEEALLAPFNWKRTKRVFVNSMSDLFHEKVPKAFIQKVFQVMKSNPQHNFQVLTKRAERLAKLSPYLNWSDNIWMGVSVESEKFLSRVDLLKSTEAKVKFLSLEPLLGPLHQLNVDGIDWVIVGGESGYKARLMNPFWVNHIQTICQNTNTPFFFKQWGGPHKKEKGRVLNGKTYSQFPPI
ncbi:phage Gp37/Gp68 family protein [Persicobacter diffluens]|uniref:Phage Gp37/Gp68 family protein n=1 Tax=Persicobacter diffluens TaxID=981 RepID=A0AAN4W5P1_9BACT|nr:hypothetical protein PEDI_53540 [Persicobacter diffluens]